MRSVDLRALIFPTQVRNVVFRLLAGIEAAESVQALRMAHQRAEGFVLGLETAVAAQADDVEAMYIGFEQAMDKRLAVLLDAG